MQNEEFTYTYTLLYETPLKLLAGYGFSTSGNGGYYSDSILKVTLDPVLFGFENIQSLERVSSLY